MRAGGVFIPMYVKTFLKSKKKSAVVVLSVLDEGTGNKVEIMIRLVRGPSDSEGKPIVFATNLLDEQKYSRKWKARDQKGPNFTVSRGPGANGFYSLYFIPEKFLYCI